jgi:hypothetical protein
MALQYITRPLKDGEEGHGAPLIGAIIGGVALAVGLVAMLVIQHTRVEWDMMARLDKLEKK